MDIGQRLLSNVIAPPGRGLRADLQGAEQAFVGDVFYIYLDYTVEGPTFSRHNCAVCAVAKGNLYSLNAQSPQRMWDDSMTARFTRIVKSFQVLP